jgi:CDP-diacylglycerol--glycerol-3-phosphate 3-phosphatidyltransferase
LSSADGGAVGNGSRIDTGAIAPPGLVNIANALTMLRLAMVPVFVLLLLAGGSGSRIAAFAVFGVASVTDLLDGELARRRSLITDFGKITDPIADKALTGSALITLSALGELPWWVTGVIAFRELAVTGLRFWVIRQGVIAASRGGKIKTLLQVIAISLFILPVHVAAVKDTIMAAAVLITVITGGDYVLRALRLRRAVPRHRLPKELQARGTETRRAEAIGADVAGAALAGADPAGAGTAVSGTAGAGSPGAEPTGAEAGETGEAR